MDAKTLEALNASIEKWERNAEAEEPNDYLTSADDCPLCLLFFWSGCDGCPVAQRTGERVCRDTPYVEAARAWEVWEDFDPEFDKGDITTAKAAALEGARAEVAFLKSLLPSSPTS